VLFERPPLAAGIPADNINPMSDSRRVEVFDAVFRKGVIRIHKHKPFSGGRQIPGFSCLCHSFVGLVDQSDASVSCSKVLCDFLAPVCASVVDDDDLERRIGLFHNRPDTLSDMALLIIQRDDHRNQ